jgi:hypothetical protein
LNGDPEMDHMNGGARAGVRPGGEGDVMTTYSNTPDPEGEKPPSFGIGKFLFVVLLAVVFFLLVNSMVHHRFFKGGRVNRHGTIVP